MQNSAPVPGDGRDRQGHEVHSDQEVMAFSLTDPDQLTSQLDVAQLDDEETELLLAEALKLNAQLKKKLRHQQLDESPTPPSHTPKQGSSKGGRSKANGGHGKVSMSTPSHPLQEQFARRQPAPQVVGGTKAKLPPIGSNLGGSTGAGREQKQTNTSPKKGRQGSAKKTKKPVDNRPAWDDRFSFD